MRVGFSVRMKGGATSEDHVGHYRLLEVLGEGGMGVVHLGVDPEGRKVAVKVLRPAVADDTTALRRLAREVDTMRRVHSPHVAEILDADVTAERPYVVTQYVPGRTLEQIVLEDAGPMSGRPLQRLAVGLANALTAIHGAGVIHRDVKPGNVMFLDGEPILIDFGIAQVIDATRLTATGMVVGTPGYLAPEIIEGDDAAAPADIHSWAGTVVFAATGRPPFGGGTFESVFYKIMQGAPDLDGVPHALLPLIRSAMALHPAERPTATKLLNLARRIDLDATRTDPTLVDAPMPMHESAMPQVSRPKTTVPLPPAPPEPPPAQPKDFKGQLPPAAPPPPPAPPPAPANPPYGRQPYPPPYDRPPYGQQPYGDRPQPPTQPGQPGQQPPPAKPYGWYRFIGLLLLGVAAGFTVQLPIMTIIVVVVVLFLLRVGDRAGQSLMTKRARTGPSAGDVVGAVLKSPFGIPRALLTTLLVTPVALLAGAVLLPALLVTQEQLATATAVSYSGLAVVGLLCLGPGSRSPRRQLARVWGVLLPRRQIAMIVALCLAVFAVVVVAMSVGQSPDLRPLPDLADDLDRFRSDVQQLLGLIGQ
jgi:serine/threonine protein kinase